MHSRAAHVTQQSTTAVMSSCGSSGAAGAVHDDVAATPSSGSSGTADHVHDEVPDDIRICYSVNGLPYLETWTDGSATPSSPSFGSIPTDPEWDVHWRADTPERTAPPVAPVPATGTTTASTAVQAAGPMASTASTASTAAAFAQASTAASSSKAKRRRRHASSQS